jgi:hypothetical protein
MKTHQSKTNENANVTNAGQSVFAGKKQASVTLPSFSRDSMIQKKLNLAQESTSQGLDKETKPELENFLNYSLDKIRIHNNPAAHEASDLIHAKAYTTGNHIFLGTEANAMSSLQRKSLLAHEVVHSIQQKSFSPTTIQTKSIIDSPQSPHEFEANSIAQDFVQQHSEGYQSTGLAMRRHSRIGTVSSPVIQRNIKDSKKLINGTMELDFTKNDATAIGALANETGTAKFTPNATAPNSNNIRLIQIVRTTDTAGVTSGTAGTAVDYAKVGKGEEADRNQVMTTRDAPKNIAGDFFIDHSAASADPRTKKSDATVSPYYRDYWPNASDSQDGYKKSKKDIQAASLWDSPGSTAAIKFNFVTSAKGADTGTWYGSALWGFEIYLDKGIAKIKGEYNSFRNYQGETTDAALEKFNEFYKNPGTPGAPTK